MCEGEGERERDLDKAVMKMKADKRSGHTGFSSNGFCNYGLNDFVCLWARAVVELRVEVASIGVVREAKRCKGEHC